MINRISGGRRVAGELVLRSMTSYLRLELNDLNAGTWTGVTYHSFASPFATRFFSNVEFASELWSQCPKLATIASGPYRE
jgi:hypothetical protein